MKRVEWDYTTLAETYSQRPNYADAAIDEIVASAGLAGGDPVVDLGAGTGHMTLKLADRGLDVTAVEPNPNMRRIGMSRTAALSNVRWRDALMEQTELPSGAFALTSYGSSFGVTDYAKTLAEAYRLLQPRGFLVALFNHRDLDDPLQRGIEELIRREVPNYQYGNRRVDQVPMMEACGWLTGIRQLEVSFVHEQPRDEWIAAWSSHATLARQAGERFHGIVDAISKLVTETCSDIIRVPYTTRVWIGQRA